GDMTQFIIITMVLPNTYVQNCIAWSLEVSSKVAIMDELLNFEFGTSHIDKFRKHFLWRGLDHLPHPNITFTGSFWYTNNFNGYLEVCVGPFWIMRNDNIFNNIFALYRFMATSLFVIP
ncbi:hypothetical protein ACJX0J_035925, partial [Zea mays]